MLVCSERLMSLPMANWLCALPLPTLRSNVPQHNDGPRAARWKARARTCGQGASAYWLAQNSNTGLVSYVRRASAAAYAGKSSLAFCKQTHFAVGA